MTTTKKTAAYRLSAEDFDRVERLSELLGESRTDVIRRAVRALARIHGVTAGETVGRVRELIDRHDPDAEVVLAVQLNTANVPVSIGGKPTRELVAAAWLRPPAVDETEDGRAPLPEPVKLSLWIRKSDPRITFKVDDQRPGTTLRFPVGDLLERLVIAPEPDAETVRSNRELRAAAGYPPDDDEEELPLD
jgi:hypothetical protein